MRDSVRSAVTAVYFFDYLHVFIEIRPSLEARDIGGARVNEYFVRLEQTDDLSDVLLFPFGENVKV